MGPPHTAKGGDCALLLAGMEGGTAGPGAPAGQMGDEMAARVARRRMFQSLDELRSLRQAKVRPALRARIGALPQTHNRARLRPPSGRGSS